MKRTHKVEKPEKIATIHTHLSDPNLVVVSMYEDQQLILRRQYDDLDVAYQTARLWAAPENRNMMQ